MNGRIATRTRPAYRLSPRNPRTLLLAVCCALSLALLGAVRLAPQLRPAPLLAVSEPTIAGWNDETSQTADHADDASQSLGALNNDAEPTLVNSALPPGVELLRAAAPPEPKAISAVPSLVVPPATPTLVGPRTRQMLMEVTAYCACPRCCGPRAQGITASGRRVSYNGGRFVAADTRLLKFNTKLRIPGYASNQPVEVIDRGGAIKGNKLDVFFASHQEARKWGRQKLWVTVVE